MEANNFPGVVGCLDGTQIALVAPKFAQHPELYVNRKGYHSINTQVVCILFLNHIFDLLT